RRIADDAGRQARAVDNAVGDDAGKGGLDLRRGAAAIARMHRRVGIERGGPPDREQRRDGLIAAADPASEPEARQQSSDILYRSPAIERTPRRVGIERGGPLAAEHRRNGRLAAGDRSGEPEEQHQPSAIEACTAARSAGPTVGRTPNQRSKPGTAWWSSMPRPP